MSSMFVAGATGYTGREVVRLGCQAGHQMIAHIRPGSSKLDDFRQRFEELGAQVDTTPWEDEAMIRTLRERAPTHVFALLGTTRSRARSEGMEAKEAYDRVDYGLTVLLLHAAASYDPPPRFVYLSAAGVPSEEPSNRYLRARFRVEQALREGGVPYTIARPSFITGEDRDESRPLERLGATLADGALAIAGALGARRLRDRYRSTSNTELARGLLRVATDPAYENALVASEELR